MARLETITKFVGWVVGSESKARSLLRRSLTVLRVGTPLDKQGNKQGGMDGVPSGGVVWPVDPDTHDGASFIASDVFWAHYDEPTQNVYCLDELAASARHPGQVPLQVGQNVFLAQPGGGLGIVIRTAKFGTDGLAKNIFIKFSGLALIAHHLNPNPPDNSTHVFDPDDQGRSAGLHGLMRVVAWLEPFGGATSTSSTPLTNLMQLALNGSKSAGDSTGWLATYFAFSEACLSAEVGGPMWHAGPGDSLIGSLGGILTSDGRDIRQGAVNIGPFGLFTVDTTDMNTGPLDWEPDEDPDCADVGLWHRVHFRADRDFTRTNFVGDPTKVKHRWSVRIPHIVEPDCHETWPSDAGMLTDKAVYMANPNIQTSPSVATPFRMNAVQYSGRATPWLLSKGRKTTP